MGKKSKISLKLPPACERWKLRLGKESAKRLREIARANLKIQKGAHLAERHPIVGFQFKIHKVI